MHEIPPIAWVIIVIFCLFIVGLNFSLVIALRDGKTFQLPKPKASRSAQTIKNASDLLRQPFAEEQSQLNELAGLVQNLKKEVPEADQDTKEKDSR